MSARAPIHAGQRCLSLAPAPELRPYQQKAVNAAMPLRDVLHLASSRAELERVAMIRGYKRGWVEHVLRERMDRTGWRRFG